MREGLSWVLGVDGKVQCFLACGHVTPIVACMFTASFLCISLQMSPSNKDTSQNRAQPTPV